MAAVMHWYFYVDLPHVFVANIYRVYLAEQFFTKIYYRFIALIMFGGHTILGVNRELFPH